MTNPSPDAEAVSALPTNTDPVLGVPLPKVAQGPGKPRSLAFHFDFRQLWAGDTISQIGGAVSGLAIP